MSYLDVTTTGMAHHLGTHIIEEYLVAYVQPLICQLLRVLAHLNIEIGDVLRFTQAQQHNTLLLIDHLNHSFLEVQGVLVQMDHHIGDVRRQLDLLVPQLNLELPGVIRELLDHYGLLAEWIHDITTLGNNTERFIMELAEGAEALKAMIAQLR